MGREREGACGNQVGINVAPYAARFFFLKGGQILVVHHKDKPINDVLME